MGFAIHITPEFLLVHVLHVFVHFFVEPQNLPTSPKYPVEKTSKIAKTQMYRIPGRFSMGFAIHITPEFILSICSSLFQIRFPPTSKPPYISV